MENKYQESFCDLELPFDPDLIPANVKGSTRSSLLSEHCI